MHCPWFLAAACSRRRPGWWAGDAAPPARSLREGGWSFRPRPRAQAEQMETNHEKAAKYKSFEEAEEDFM